MTEPFPEPVEPTVPVTNDEEPLEPWVVSLADEVTFPSTVTVPREMMWARIQRDRRDAFTELAPLVPAAVPTVEPTAVPPVFPMAIHHTRRRSWLYRAAGIAAVLVAGVGVGRYVLPTAFDARSGVDSAAVAVSRADSIAALGFGPDALAAMPVSNEPVRVAMEEHLVRTVALLMTVRDDDPAFGPGADISGWARELLSTTRMLIDEPQLSDARTHRLLQDLELVLAQIVQARGSVPETQRAPSETMRETNLLPRVRAAATASRLGDDPILGGDI
jgi:hypothetical protein